MEDENKHREEERPLPLVWLTENKILHRGNWSKGDLIRFGLPSDPLNACKIFTDERYFCQLNLYQALTVGVKFFLKGEV